MSNAVTIGIQGPPGPLAASVANPAALTALATTTFVAGTLANIKNDANGNALHPPANFAYDPTSVATADNYFFIPAAGGGNWVRTATAVLVTEPQPQTVIYIDPKNDGGSGTPGTNTASDGNDGTTIGKALRTYNQQARRWGGYSPRVALPTVVTCLSSHTDNTDPILLDLIAQGSTLTLQGVTGAGQQVATGTLASVVARVRGGPGNLLQATLAAGLVVGQKIVNITRGSCGFLHKSLGANAWAITQTQINTVVPRAIFNPAEDNGWANGDTYVVYNQISLNIGRLRDTIAVGLATGVRPLQVYNLNIMDPTASSLEEVIISDGIDVIECSINRVVCASSPQPVQGTTYINSFLRDGIYGGAGLARHSAAGLSFWGGVVGHPSSQATLVHPVGAAWLADVIVAPSGSPQTNSAGSSRIGSIYLDTNSISHAEFTAYGPCLFLTVGFEPTVVWGPGTIGTVGHARLSYQVGAGKAVAVFLNSGGILLNSQTTACFDSVNNAGARTTGNAITPANMDTLMGAATGGSLYVPGGSSIANDGSSL